MRFGLGPVFAYEWLRTSRRWQLYAMRSAFVGALFFGLFLSWNSWSGSSQGYEISELAVFGRSIYSTVSLIQLTLILLVAPAATAGTVCLDKARGSLLQVMATDLTDREIVLGKLCAGLLPIVGLVFCVMPVLMLSSLLGGIDPTLLVCSFVVTLSTAVFVSTLAFTLSVWGRKTHEVLGATYLILVAWLILTPVAISFNFFLMDALGGTDWLRFQIAQWILIVVEFFHPYGLIQPDFGLGGPGRIIPTLVYATGCIIFSALMIGVVVWRIRRVVVNQRTEAMVQEPKGAIRKRVSSPIRLLPVPSLDANPVLWREWSRNQPSRWGRFLWNAYGFFAVCLAGGALVEILGRDVRLGAIWIMMNVYLVSMGLLFIVVRACSVMEEERIRGSLDVLLATPLSTREIVAGKWWGIFRPTVSILILPALIGFLICVGSGGWGRLVLVLMLIVSYTAFYTTLGLAISVAVSRSGRALGLGVGLYAASCVGWPILAGVTLEGPQILYFFLLLGSPVVGTGFASMRLFSSEVNLGSSVDDMLPSLLVLWCVLNSLTAFVLFQSICASFDRKMGRISDPSESFGIRQSLEALIPRFGERRLDESEDVTKEPAGMS